jgi:hypothetical protein
MDMWPNDGAESKRVCPYREQSCRAMTFDSYRQMLAHCRQQHRDKPPAGGDPTTELVMTDTRGRVLSWEEVRRMIEHPLFWQRPEGIVLPGAEVA